MISVFYLFKFLNFHSFQFHIDFSHYYFHSLCFDLFVFPSTSWSIVSMPIICAATPPLLPAAGNSLTSLTHISLFVTVPSNSFLFHHFSIVSIQLNYCSLSLVQLDWESEFAISSLNCFGTQTRPVQSSNISL